MATPFLKKFKSNIRVINLSLAAMVLGAVVIWAIILGRHPLYHDDLFFHLQTGEVVAKNGVIPVTDSFSFTRKGTPWISHEWGFGLLCYGFYWLAGLWGLIILKISVILAILVALTRLSVGDARFEKWVLVGPLLALAIWAAKRTLHLKASLFSALGIILLLLLFRRHQKTGKRLYLFVVAGMIWIWANMHCGVIFGLFTVGLFTLEAVLGGFKKHLPPRLQNRLRYGPPKDYLVLLMACIAVAFLNPNGINSLLFPFLLNRFLYGGGISLELGEFASPAPSAYAGFYLILILLLVGLLLNKKLKEANLAPTLLYLTFLILALRSNRFICDFALLSVPFLTAVYASILRHWRKRKFLLYAVTTSTTFLVALVALGFSSVTMIRDCPQPLVKQEFPVAAANFISKAGIRGHMFNYQNHGGYLHWRLKQPIFWDGRTLVFTTLLKEFQTTFFPDILKRYAVDYLILEKYSYSKIKPFLDQMHWGLVYWDDQSAVYLARITKFIDILDRYEYKIFKPFGDEPEINAIVTRPKMNKQAMDELNQALGDNPHNQTALFFKGMLFMYEEKYAEADASLENALHIKPHYKIYTLLAYTKAKLGDKAGATRYIKKAIALQPPGDDFISQFIQAIKKKKPE